MDPVNPTCPKSLNWSNYRQMRFSTEQVNGRNILRAEGLIDDGVVERLQAALAAAEGGVIDEIWIRSPGGNARVGNAAGRVIRESGIPTRIPKGWSCFSACNFMFMGGLARFVDADGHFIVHMFTHIADRQSIRSELATGGDKTIGLIASVEQDSAILASEDNDFLIRMGVSRKLLTEVMYRQKAVEEQGADRSTRRCLTADETLRYNVANMR
ncbi:hypothetical protein C7I55_23105 [Sphingomonas deserti]|uniref:Uncharacterized protein n=2 Tax=Allosphingosinicella deserti TaxID=2116704 RepID=A0A2P7QHJ4_9SPHN|nr:hypothetical protein C7I55_23105 [Sphingomonas deserti]